MLLRCKFLCCFLTALIFIKIGLKLSYFCQKNTKFSGPRGSTPRPRASGGWGLCPRTPASGGCRLCLQTLRCFWRLRAPPSNPRNTPPIANFWLRACWCESYLLSFKMSNVVSKTSDVSTFKGSDGDINLVTAIIICQRDSDSLRTLLKKNSIDVLPCHRVG